MAVIYVREQRSVVRKRGGRLVVEKEGATLLEIPLRETTAVAIFGSVQVTTQALTELLDRGISLALHTRNGRLKGHLSSEISKNVTLRIAQYHAALSEQSALGIARLLVVAKLKNTAVFLSEFRANHPSEALAMTWDALQEAAASAAQAEDHSQLLGCEGSGAAAWFETFAQMNRSELPFPGREKHPAPDPVNALLSFGYTLALHEIRATVEAAGLEPHLGFLHRVEYGRPSLALDLLEPFRATLVDRLTLSLINERILKAEDFGKRISGPQAGSVILMPEALRRYLERYEAAITEPRVGADRGMRHEMAKQVDRLAGALRDSSAFQPYQAVA